MVTTADFDFFWWLKLALAMAQLVLVVALFRGAWDLRKTLKRMEAERDSRFHT